MFVVILAPLSWMQALGGSSWLQAATVNFLFGNPEKTTREQHTNKSEQEAVRRPIICINFFIVSLLPPGSLPILSPFQRPPCFPCPQLLTVRFYSQSLLTFFQWAAKPSCFFILPWTEVTLLRQGEMIVILGTRLWIRNVSICTSFVFIPLGPAADRNCWSLLIKGKRTIN